MIPGDWNPYDARRHTRHLDDALANLSFARGSAVIGDDPETSARLRKNVEDAWADLARSMPSNGTVERAATALIHSGLKQTYPGDGRGEVHVTMPRPLWNDLVDAVLRSMPDGGTNG